MSATKNPAKVRAGKIGAAKRWGTEPRTPRVVRLDSLTSEQRRLVIALVEAARQEGAAPEPSPAEASAAAR